VISIANCLGNFEAVINPRSSLQNQNDTLGKWSDLEDMLIESKRSQKQSRLSKASKSNQGSSMSSLILRRIQCYTLWQMCCFKRCKDFKRFVMSFKTTKKKRLGAAEFNH